MNVEQQPAAGPVRRQISSPRTRGDRIFHAIARASGFGTFVLLFLIGLFLLLKAWPALRYAGWGFFTRTEWIFNPATGGGTFGILAILYWTIVIAVIALVIAVPVSLAAALFITEFAPRRIKGPLTSLIDLLAAVPSVVFGLWGIMVLAPAVQPVYAWLNANMGWFPLFSGTVSSTGRTIFTAAIVLAVMVVPIITAICREIFLQTPVLHEEAALALGATRWEMLRMAVLPYSRAGISGAAMLGLGRAIGETIAATLVIGNAAEIGNGIFSQGYTLAAVVANEFGEAASDPVHRASLIAAGLVLFVLTLAVNAGARWFVLRSERTVTR